MSSPSIPMLFSLLPTSYRLLLLLPAISASIIAGGIAPFMTFVVGQTFAAFAQYPSSNPSTQDKDRLLHNVGIAALQLVALSVGALALSSITSSLWISTAERNVLALRRRVYDAVMSMDMHWFDSNSTSQSDDQGPLGAAGLMAKFTRETDDVRAASSLALGQLIQYLTTTITCLALAFSRSWSLTLVILSALPLLVIIQSLSQSLATPLLSKERSLTSKAASQIDRSTSSISTVKAFNAQSFELSSTSRTFDALTVVGVKLNAVWGLTSALAQFSTLAMFVQGFWFGAKLVREGKTNAGDVMAVFWACLIATSNLQMCIPQMIVIAKGKEACWALLELVNQAPLAPPPPPSEEEGREVVKSRALRKIKPETFAGEFSLVDVTFTYPTLYAASSSAASINANEDAESSIPDPDTPTTLVNMPPPSTPKLFPPTPTTPFPIQTPPTLQNITLYLPANETTFIVGTSGSGKSTLASLLLGLYTPQSGDIYVDERDVRFVDERWLRERVGAVGQGLGGDVVFEGMSVWENVAAGVKGGTVMDPTREEVEEACRAALLHEFILGLPDGYDTILSSGSGSGSATGEGSSSSSGSASSGGGGGGVCLSGGQRQRLAIARARLRNPSVLILDEATSSLDPTSRILVLAALRTWRKNKTTIVITHDLSQIEEGDFVYVLKEGRVVEQGYRADLERGREEGEEGGYEKGGEGEFRKMLDVQQMGLVKGVDDDLPPPEYDDDDEEEDEEYDEDDEYDLDHDITTRSRPQTYLRPLTFGNWMFDVVAELTAPTSAAPKPLPAPPTTTTTTTSTTTSMTVGRKLRRPLSIHVDIPEPALVRNGVLGHRRSLQFTPTSPVFSPRSRALLPEKWDEEEEDEEKAFEGEKKMITKSGGVVLEKRRGGGGGGKRRVEWRVVKESAGEQQFGKEKKKEKWADRLSLRKRAKKTPKHLVGVGVEDGGEEDQQPPLPGFWATVRKAWPTVPYKPLVILGFLICAISGAMTPIFSFLLSRLLFEVSIGAQNVSLINRFGGIVLGIAGLDGLLLGLKYFIMESTAQVWITSLRRTTFGRVLEQDKSWFETTSTTSTTTSSSSHLDNNTTPTTPTPVRLVQIIVKDADDARNLLAIVASQSILVSTMLLVGLFWALSRGWELTLVGLGIAPVFAGVMAVQTVLVARCELRNKRAREEVARGYYEAVANVRGMRAMGFEAVFRGRFVSAANVALRTGVRGAFVEGASYGVASGLIYLAEALLFYVGAVLIVRGRYTYLQMVEVLNLVVFTVTIGSQLMAFTQRIAKSVQATSDFQQLQEHATSKPSDSTGSLQPALSGSNASITFSNVNFSYPSRPDVPVLRNLNLSIAPGESVAIVGASGSGKSTIASLLQRLYEPSSGNISIANIPLHDIDSTYLRDHVSVVSQHPHLFDASVAENIRYGSGTDKVSDVDVRTASKAANAHAFVMGLPHGYDTLVGENATLVSGGQAQRLQIARALVRPSDVLVLDECTSALDAENQRAVMEAVKKVKEQGGRTTVMVTHKLQVMKMCDRIVLVDDGQVKEEGTFEALIRKKGLFATLASGGEWLGD